MTETVHKRVAGEKPPPTAEVGERFGRVSVSAGGEKVGESPLVVGEGYEEASLWQRTWYIAQRIFREEKEESA